MATTYPTPQLDPDALLSTVRHWCRVAATAERDMWVNPMRNTEAVRLDATAYQARMCAAQLLYSLGFNFQLAGSYIRDNSVPFGDDVS